MIEQYYLHRSSVKITEENYQNLDNYEYIISSDKEVNPIINGIQYCSHKSTGIFTIDPYADYTELDIIEKHEKGICRKAYLLPDNELEKIQKYYPNILFIWKID